MPTTPKVLGQSSPAAATLTALYTVAAGRSAIVSTLTICNTTAAAVTARVRVAIAGAADAASQAVYHEIYVPAYDTFSATIGITLNAADVLRVYASATGVSFTAFGTENS